MGKFEGMSQQERRRKVAHLPDEEIDYSDIPENAFESMSLVKRGPLTTPISIRIGTDVLQGLQEIAEQKEEKYQTLINDILRTYVAGYRKREGDSGKELK